MIPAVNVLNIKKTYGGLDALSNVAFTVEKGSFFGLLGPNGAGKSTLINIMAGLTRADKGSIEVLGYDVLRQWRQARSVLGIVPQELAYDPFFTAREMLKLQSGYFGKDRSNHAWVDELLERLNLGKKADENLHQLSGGMKRRVLIAQALVHRPKVVVLDEPTAGVDVELRRVLWDFIRQLHDNGHTIVLTTHYLEEAEMLCDRIAILDKGRLIENDTTPSLLRRYPYRILHLTMENGTTGLPDGLHEKVVSVKNKEISLRLHREKDSINSILDSLRAAQITFKDLRTEDPGLEEVFLALTGGDDA